MRERDLIQAARQQAFQRLPQPEVTQAAVREGVPEQIGKYRIIRCIGSGGMGTVYEAIQESPHRRVALKIIKPGKMTEDAKRRFDYEVRLLGQLKHPGIAQIFEAGTFQLGGDLCPFFSMEFVAGKPITDFAETTGLASRDRLRLFGEVCAAVWHAHLKGIIHRDLKPANILVEASGQPKVLDFGVARATDADADTTMHTQFGQLVGTLPYMSPEQVAGDPDDVDIRSDQYSLGVVLYELLAGHLPYDLRGKSIQDVARTICEVQPLSLGSSLAEFRGDVETIVAKAMDKDRMCRYATVADLAADVRRHLLGEPILARPTSAWDRTLKWAKRRPAAAALIGVATLALLIISALSMGSYFSIRSALASVTLERDNAGKARNSEHRQRMVAEARERAGYYRLYTSDMLLAQQYWSEGQTGRVVALLDDHLPQPGRSDLRGFEWYRTWRQCHSEVATLFDHDGEVTALAVAPDGRQALVGRANTQAELWDLSSRNIISRLSGHTRPVSCVAFSSDGKTAVAASVDGTIRLWDGGSPERVTLCKGHTGQVADVAFLAGDKVLASGGWDGFVRLWDRRTGQQQTEIETSASRILSIALAPDESLLAVAGELLGGGKKRYCVFLLDIAKRKLIRECPASDALIDVIRFSPDGQWLAVGHRDGSVALWTRESLRDGDSGPTSFRAHSNVVSAIAFSPDGALLATGGWDQTVRLFELASRQPVAIHKGHSGPIQDVAFANQGTTLVSASRDGSIKLWKSRPKADRVALRATKAAAAQFSALSPDLQTLAYATGGGEVVLFDLETGEELRAIKCHRLVPLAMGFASDGRTLATGSFDDAVKIWNVATGEKLSEFNPQTSAVRFVTLAPDKRSLATGNEDNAVLLWDVATGKMRRRLAFPASDSDHNIHRGVFSPDGKLLAAATGSKSGAIRVWDAAKGQELAQLTGHESGVWGLAFSPDNEHLASASGDATARLWEARTGKARTVLKGHVGVVFTVAYSPDGKRLATGGADGIVKLWDAASGAERGNMLVQQHPITDVAFSRDGKTLIAVSAEGAVHSLRAATDAEVAARANQEYTNSKRQ